MSNSATPIDTSITQNLLSNYLEQPITATKGHYYELVKQEAWNIPPTLDALCLDLEKTFGWHSANPSDPEKIEKFHQLYYIPRHARSHSNGNGTNHDERHAAVDKFADYMLGHETTPLKIVGRRGGGKTALTNYVLTTHHTELQSRDITWLRADIAKLHAINIDRVGTRPERLHNSISINCYMALHAFHVMIQYAPQDKIFRVALGDEKNYPPDGSTPTIFEEHLNSISRKLGETWRTIRGAELARAAAVENKQDLKRDDQDLKQYINNCLNRIKPSEAEEIFHHLWNFITQQYRRNYNEALPKIALVFDGVDNLRADQHSPREKLIGGKTSREWYFTYLSEMLTYANKAGNCLPNDRCIFVIREDTETDLITALPHQQNAIGHWHRIEVDIPDYEELFTRKIEYFSKKDLLGIHEDGHRLTKTENLEAFQWCWRKFNAEHISRIRRVYEKRVSHPEDTNIVIQIVFNGNLRSYTRNLIRSFFYLRQYAISHPDYSRCESYSDRRHFYETHSYLIYEGSLLGGNSYLRANSDDRTRGRWFPNFFEVTPSELRAWNGLAILRLLQYLPLQLTHQQEGVSLSKLKSTLRLIGYEDEIVHHCCFFCLEHGLISLGTAIVQDECNEKNPSLLKTMKGDFVSKIILTEAPTLYIASTASKLAVPNPTQVLEIETNSFVHRAHRTQGSRFFRISVLRTSTLMLRHIKSAHKDDMTSLREREERETQATHIRNALIRRINNPSEIEKMSTLELMEAHKILERNPNVSQTDYNELRHIFEIKFRDDILNSLVDYADISRCQSTSEAIEMKQFLQEISPTQNKKGPI